MDDLTQQLARADSLALQARAAAQAGDYKRAAELRAEFEKIYDSVIDTLTPVGYAYIQEGALETGAAGDLHKAEESQESRVIPERRRSGK